METFIRLIAQDLIHRFGYQPARRYGGIPQQTRRTFHEPATGCRVRTAGMGTALPYHQRTVRFFVGLHPLRRHTRGMRTPPRLCRARTRPGIARPLFTVGAKSCCPTSTTSTSIWPTLINSSATYNPSRNWTTAIS